MVADAVAHARYSLVGYCTIERGHLMPCASKLLYHIRADAPCAAGHATRSPMSWPPSSIASRPGSARSGHLSTAFALQSEPEQASVVLHEAIDLAELTSNAGGLRRAFAAGRQLGRWRNEPFVQEVHDRLLALAC